MVVHSEAVLDKTRRSVYNNDHARGFAEEDIDKRCFAAYLVSGKTVKSYIPTSGLTAKRNLRSCRERGRKYGADSLDVHVSCSRPLLCGLSIKARQRQSGCLPKFSQREDRDGSNQGFEAPRANETDSRERASERCPF